MAAGKSVGWLEAARGGEGPIYASIARALELAIRRGELHPGDRLPPQRAVAEQLGVDLTTVTRAYAAAQTMGLVEGTVGRGTFVRARTEDDEAGLVDLSMNLPPPPDGLSLGALLRDTTAAILDASDAATLMAYHPGFGTLGQRQAGAQWLAPCLGEVASERMLVAPGAQAALAAILAAHCPRGSTVVAEALTYPGFLALAQQLDLRVAGCEADREGLIPDALRAICARERPSAVYAIPTLQNPTASTAGPKRRAELAAAIAVSGAILVEDDPYAMLLAKPLPGIASLIPQRTYYIGTLSKTLSPGLRIAYVACPDAAGAERVASGLRATALMPAPLMAAVATRWIREGVAERLLGAVRAEAAARRAIAAEALPQALGGAESIHIWLPLDPGVSTDRLRLVAQQRGLALVTDEAFAATAAHPPGVRISLGAASRRPVVGAALRNLAQLVAGDARPADPVI